MEPENPTNYTIIHHKYQESVNVSLVKDASEELKTTKMAKKTGKKPIKDQKYINLFNSNFNPLQSKYVLKAKPLSNQQ